MELPKKRTSFFPSASEDAHAAKLHADSPQTQSPSYALSFLDTDFMMRDELRPVRLQLELLKPEIIQMELNIASTVVIFGSARIKDSDTAKACLEKRKAEAEKHPDAPDIARKLQIAQRDLDNSRYYDEARRLARMIASAGQDSNGAGCVVSTGGGPGIMEAANRGAHDVNAKSIGLNIVLPHEQAPNPYITPELSFQFHYFAIRKMHFLIRAKALIAFPGGFGTMDELFETLTLVQTKKIAPIPILLFGKRFWQKVIHFDALVEAGTVSPEDLDLFHYVETAEEGWAMLNQYK
ncbi:MAG TPA: TIGR00730 family Rossman fold protein [Desulfotignum sp.]|nr:TIGR00730 family Rossman fold protein [Desulfotignum sp.]